MRVWRLTRPDYAPGLDGLGARKEGGRWNSPGRPAVYCGGSLALSCLEVFVHLPPSMRTTEKLPALTAVELDLPDELPRSEAAWADIPKNPEIADFRAIGDLWLAERKTAILSVPSLIIEAERNYILNPEHPDMDRIEILSQQPFRFDGRMASGR
ncbi:RES family NAD+ phosphorylase [Salipiger abyssi]|uniref:RES family NAD+ phosphorylase n=1 Tax=Salipiger abyssi TaxID=1250539 RepID=UPI001A8DBE16|nr:RES family NAD+ phosphorylase [Salipiger abyssi]MBN9886840.1 RES family NAD+ phosphorylase [Salipiger abyssi]